MSEAHQTAPLLRTPLHRFHVERGARLVAFAGYEMPVHYPTGILTEHLHTRAAAGLFDISHMGQIAMRPMSGRLDDTARALETLVPIDVIGIGEGRQRYALFTNPAGGILDDLIIAHRGDHLLLVVNAACKDADLAHLVAQLDSAVALEPRFERALLALQGPAAAAVLARFAAGVEHMPFMSAGELRVAGARCWVSRSGYTGEDGFEISLAADDAVAVAETLLAQPEVMPIGLGARDTLRLEAGLCLYGHDIDETTTPIEAGLAWTIPKRRREAGGFPGARTILRQLAAGPACRRVGIRPDGRAPAREDTAILDPGGNPIGRVTSGGFGPSLGAPVAMGYLAAAHAAAGGALQLVVRDVPRPARVVPLPFVPTRYYRG